MEKRKKTANFPKGSIYPSIRAQQRRSLKKQGGTGHHKEKKSTSFFESTTQYNKPMMYPLSYSTLNKQNRSEGTMKFRSVHTETGKVKIVKHKNAGEVRLIMLSERQSWESCSKFLAVDSEGHFRTFLLDQLPFDYLVLDVPMSVLSETIQRFASAGAALVDSNNRTTLSQVLQPL